MSSHPLFLGQWIDGYQVLAWGYYLEENDEHGDILSALMLLPHEKRVPNEKNYACAFVEVQSSGRLQFSEMTYFPNIVPAVAAYQDEYGMDW